MPVDSTSGKFVTYVVHDLNNFLNEVIYNTGALWGLKVTGAGDWVYNIAPGMRGEMYDAMREALVIGGIYELKRFLQRQGWSMDFMLSRF